MPRAPGGEPAIATVAIDALCLRAEQKAVAAQVQPGPLLRELVKAFAGFSAPAPEVGAAERVIATGHWGCGAFGGHRGVKALVQWVAASAAGKGMVYCACNRRLPPPAPSPPYPFLNAHPTAAARPPPRRHV